MWVPETKLGPLQEYQMLLTTDPFLQPQNTNICNNPLQKSQSTDICVDICEYML